MDLLLNCDVTCGFGIILCSAVALCTGSVNNAEKADDIYLHRKVFICNMFLSISNIESNVLFTFMHCSSIR